MNSEVNESEARPIINDEIIIFPKVVPRDIPPYCFLILKRNQEIFFAGRLKITVLFGSCSILGFKMKRNDEYQEAYSPRGNCPLSLKWSKNEDKTSPAQFKRFLIDELKTTTIFYDTLSEYFDPSHDSVLKLDLLDNKLLKFLKNNIECELFPGIHRSFSATFNNKKLNESQIRIRLAEQVLQCKFTCEKEVISDKFKMPIHQKISGIGKCEMNHGDSVLICGGRGLGKSTLFRYLINKNLSVGKTVIAIDFDIGQSEFMVPGCIGAARVQKPLLGPNYTHLMPVMDKLILLGDLNVVDKLDVYMDAVVEMATFCNQNFDRANTVWLINTMGFSRLDGIDINYLIIEQMKPTQVIQVKSTNDEFNYPCDFTYENVTAFESEVPWFRKSSEKLQPFRYNSFLQPVSHSKWSIDGKRSREIAILAYCSKILEKDCEYLNDVQPFKVSLEHIKLEVLDYKFDDMLLMRTIRGTFVALCKKDRHNVIGFGIVPDIDFDGRQLYLRTPVDPDILEQVDCMIKSKINLPAVLYINVGPNVTGPLPYVSRKLPNITNRRPKRNLRPYQNQNL